MNVKTLLGINVYLVEFAAVSYSLRLNGCNALGDFLLRKRRFAAFFLPAVIASLCAEVEFSRRIQKTLGKHLW